jgi:aromatic-L-amino-acid decarboxylase
MDYGVQLGRALPREAADGHPAFGVKGLQEQFAITAGSREFRRLDRVAARIRVVRPVPFSTVCFRVPDGRVAEQDRFNERLLAAVNAAGPVLLSHTKLRGQYVLRLTVGNLRTTPAHVEQARRLIDEAHRRLLGTK